jgi:hypothetical protein
MPQPAATGRESSDGPENSATQQCGSHCAEAPRPQTLVDKDQAQEQLDKMIEELAFDVAL